MRLFGVLAFAGGALSPLLSTAGSVRLSFLQDEAVLTDTAQFLTKSGFSSHSVTAFQECVRRYNLCASDLNLSGFPACQDGFYTFSNARGWALLPKRLSETEHPYDVNCFDTVLLLAADKFRTGLSPDEPCGEILAENITTNGESFALAATPRDAFQQCYAQWYRDGTEALYPTNTQSLRISLTVALFRCHVLPRSVRDDNMCAGVLSTLQATWRREGTAFPKEFELVLCHRVDLKSHFCNTVHAGLLLPRGKEFTYLEKAGGSGPFVRLDLTDRRDLPDWLRGHFLPDRTNDNQVVMTLNQTAAERFGLNDEAKKAAQKDKP